MASSDSKLFQTITLDNIRDALEPLRKAGIQFYIITAESGYCPACHSDLSCANITAPNSLLGHLRRSKKCIAKREERGVQLFGLKQPDSILWGSIDDLTCLDPRRYPDRNLWIQNTFPPTKPPMIAPVYTDMSQWHARENGGYSPPLSSASSDGEWTGYNSSYALANGGAPGQPPRGMYAPGQPMPMYAQAPAGYQQYPAAPAPGYTW